MCGIATRIVMNSNEIRLDLERKWKKRECYKAEWEREREWKSRM